MYPYLLEFDVVVYARHSTITIFSVENVCAMSGYFVLLHCMSVTCVTSRTGGLEVLTADRKK